MAKKEMQGAWDDIRAVMDELPADAEVESAHLADMGLGQTRAIITLRRGIEKAAAVFGVAEPGIEAYRISSGLETAYFAVGGVSVVQHGKRHEDEKTP